MAVVSGLTAAKMLEIAGASVVSGTVNAFGRLILTTKGGTQIDAGFVQGAKGDPGVKGDPGAAATALLSVGDTSTINLTLSGTGTPTDPWVLSADSLVVAGITIAHEVGEIFFWMGPTSMPIPVGCLELDGSNISRATYSVLWGKWGSTFGAGDGSTTFGIPDFRGKSPFGYDASQTEFNLVGKTGGEKTHLLTAAESGLREHTHLLRMGTPGTSVGSTNDLPARISGAAQSDPAFRTGQVTEATFQGGNSMGVYNNAAKGDSPATAAHQNMPPYIVGRWLVKAAYVGAEINPGTSHLHAIAEVTGLQALLDVRKYYSTYGLASNYSLASGVFSKILGGMAVIEYLGTGIRLVGDDLVADVAGVYEVIASAVFSGGAAGTRRHIITTKNCVGINGGGTLLSGSTLPGGAFEIASGSTSYEPPLSVHTARFSLNAGDTVQMFLFQDTGATLTVVAGNGTGYYGRTGFTLQRIA